MRIPVPGTNDRGFASLDAMAAILLLSLAWAAVVPVTMGILRKTENRLAIQRNLCEEKNAREKRSWYFRPFDEE